MAPDSQGDYGEPVTITVPERAIGLVVERAEFDFDSLQAAGIDPDTLDDIEGAIDTVQDAVAAAE